MKIHQSDMYYMYVIGLQSSVKFSVFRRISIFFDITTMIECLEKKNSHAEYLWNSLHRDSRSVEENACLNWNSIWKYFSWIWMYFLFLVFFLLLTKSTDERIWISICFNFIQIEIQLQTLVLHRCRSIKSMKCTYTSQHMPTWTIMVRECVGIFFFRHFIHLSFITEIFCVFV